MSSSNESSLSLPAAPDAEKDSPHTAQRGDATHIQRDEAAAPEVEQRQPATDPSHATASSPHGNRQTVTIVAVVIFWALAYNVFVKQQGLARAFFQVLDTISDDLVTGSFLVIGLGLAIVAAFSITKLYGQIIANIHSFAILGLSFIYFMSWIYVILFSEALFFLSWSSGVDLPITEKNMLLMPTLALAIPFSARVMAYLRYPYAQDYADFMPAAVFALLMVTALGYLFESGDQKFFLATIYQNERFLPDFLVNGILLAFIPVFFEAAYWLADVLMRSTRDKT
jgi:hypothetical protein